jgi:MFS superfamily sulfate permease-like transporter
MKVFAEGGAQHQLAAGIGALTIICMIAWKLLKLDKRLYLPEAVPAIILGSVIAAVFGMSINRISMPDSLGDMVTPLSMAQITGFDLSALKMALVLALIASAETLLSAASVDQLAPGERTDYDKDLRAHGVGNTVCGLLGSLPLTGVIVRSKANIEAGAKTRWSSFMHGAWLLLAVAALPWLLAHIPTCTLAALLVVTGFKLVDRAAVRDLWRYGWGETVIFVITAVLVVSTDLLMGVGVGFGLAALRMMWKVLQVDVVIEKKEECYHVYLQGAAMFLLKPIIDKKLSAIPQGSVVHLHLDGLTHMDHACLDMLAAWACCRGKTGDCVFALRGPTSTQVHKLEDLHKLWLTK